MAKFTAKELEFANINNGEQIQDGVDIVSAAYINAVIEGTAFAQEESKQAKSTSEAARIEVEENKASNAQFKTGLEASNAQFKSETTARVDELEKQIGEKQGTTVFVGGTAVGRAEFDSDPQGQLDNRVFGASVLYVIYGGAGWYRVADLSRSTSAYNFNMGGSYVTTRSPEVCGTLSIGFDSNIEPIVTVSHCRSSGWWSKFRVIYDKTAISGTAYLEIYKTNATREYFGMSLIPEYETALFKVYREETAGSIPSGYTAVEYDLQDGANFPLLKVDGNPVLHTGEMTLSDVEKLQVHRNIGLMKTETKAAVPSAWYRLFSVKKKSVYASFSFSFYVESLHNNFASGVADVNIYTYPDSTPTIKKIYYTSLSGVDLSKKIRLVEDDTNIYIAVQNFGNYNKITATILSYGFVTYSLSDFTIESVEIPEPSSYTACAKGIIQTRIDSKYTKPSTGIPETDLAQDVQDKINYSPILGVLVKSYAIEQTTPKTVAEILSAIGYHDGVINIRFNSVGEVLASGNGIYYIVSRQEGTSISTTEKDLSASTSSMLAARGTVMQLLKAGHASQDGWAIKIVFGNGYVNAVPFINCVNTILEYLYSTENTTIQNTKIWGTFDVYRA